MSVSSASDSATTTARAPARAAAFRRRIGTGLLAVAVAAGVLSLGSSPVQAAAADVETDRLRGATRYETAVDIAEAYVDLIEENTFDDDVDTAILTSGEDDHFAYALLASGLARQHTSPVLLTESDDLPNAVRRFIEDFDIRDVIIIGGSDVVSEEVEREVDGLAGVDVDRIAGDDEYSTSVEVADEIGTPGEFGRSGRTVLLATGEIFADALAAGPLAYRGGHPILLTQRDSISDDVLDYIEDSGTDQVVILGGTAAVGIDVELDVEDLGVGVIRWRGATRIETAIEIAEALLGDASPQSCFDGAEAGLAYAWRHPDAIVSGPYLGELCAPLLLTDLRVLPDEVSDMLGSDDYFTGDFRGRLRITAFGGTAAVSETVLRAAANAAELASLNARVTATEGACHFTVIFSEPVLTEDALDVRNYLIDGDLFDIGEGDVQVGAGRTTTQATVVLDGGNVESGAAVATGCRLPLSARDTVGVAPNRITSAADRRTVRRVETQVRTDNSRPRLTIVAPQGAVTVQIEADEPVVGADGASTIAVEFRRSGETPIFITADVPPGATRFEVEAPGEFDTDEDPPTTGLLARDQVVVNAGELEDLAGNENLRTSRSVVLDNSGPRASRVTVTNPAPVENAYVSLDGEDSNRDRQPGALRITAKDGTAADGAAGNEWAVEVEVLRRRPTTWRTSQYAVVEMSQARQSMSITTIEDATLADVEDDLNDDSAFSALFEAEVIAGRVNLAPLGSGGPLRFGGGSSTVDITVYWSEPVKDCGSGIDAVDPQGVEIDVDRDGNTEFALDGYIFDRTRDITFVGDNSQQTSIVAGAATCDTITSGARSGTLVARLKSNDIDDLPSTRSNAYIRPGAAHDFSGNTNRLQPAIVLRSA
ncbi:cell wall-binding repeat-containing protein [Candidatus Poriferisodalis sp.]|uniref:cell wall-binding repeat-containing protein n=1 Tax=Candidatus Poriferisodalis sp. TaxID=3101277 RepID=UPI003B0116A1